LGIGGCCSDGHQLIGIIQEENDVDNKANPIMDFALGIISIPWAGNDDKVVYVRN
jgi:hypothetical protein